MGNGRGRRRPVVAALAAAGCAAAIGASGVSGASGEDATDGGTVSPAVAVDNLQQAAPSALAPSQDAGHGIDPTVDPAANQLVVDGSLAEGTIQRDAADGFAVATDAGRLSAAPTDVAGQATDATVVAGGDGALYANTAQSTDTVVRPTATGLETFTQMRDGDAPAETSWRVSLPGDETLQPLPKGGVAVLAPAAQTDAEQTLTNSVPDTSGEPDPTPQEPAPAAESSSATPDEAPGAAAIDDAGTSGDSSGGATSPAIPDDKRIVAVVTAPAAVDAEGAEVPTSLAVAGDTVTLKVDTSADTNYPVVADPVWSPTGWVGGGWWGYGASEPLAGSRVSFENNPESDGDCGIRRDQTLDPGENRVTRQVAIFGNTCLTMVETGTAYSWNDGVDLREAFADDLGDGPLAVAAASGLHKNQGTYKNDQEDPAQIDVNEVSDTIRWNWTNHCVHGARGWPHTHQYGVTGWKRTGYNDIPLDRRCAVATKSTYAKFSGGQYFPACFGSKVTTFYANNIAQAYPAGRFRGFVYKKTGGAPCRHLLHWETHTWNRRIR
jgi:hypothetical protein